MKTAKPDRLLAPPSAAMFALARALARQAAREAFDARQEAQSGEKADAGRDLRPVLD